MKKKLLCCFTLLSMVAGQAMSQSQLCRPELTWGAYACISKVEINGMVSESSTTPEGWDGKIGSNTYDENVLFADYTMDRERVVTLEAGKEYELKITVCNFSSGAGDEYYVTAFFDWNGDSKLTAAETVFQKSIAVGKPGQSSFKVVSGKITVLADASKTFTMRTYLHYKTPDVPYTDPCSTQDGGVLQDYTVQLDGGTSIENTSLDAFAVYPNPTDGEVFIKLENANEYMLYSVDGKLVQKGMITGNSINISGNASGMYILQVKTHDGLVKRANIIIK